MNLLGVDYGSKRIGTAIGDTETRIATPLRLVPGRNDVARDARAVADLGIAQGVDAFVVGLPLNMRDGSDSEQTALTRRFAAELARLTQRPVHLQDERLTSFAAQDVLDEAEIPQKRRKRLVDLVAAQKILQAYLDALR